MQPNHIVFVAGNGESPFNRGAVVDKVGDDKCRYMAFRGIGKVNAMPGQYRLTAIRRIQLVLE